MLIATLLSPLHSQSYTLHKCSTYTLEGAQGHKLTRHWLTHTTLKDSVLVKPPLVKKTSTSKLQ